MTMMTTDITGAAPRPRRVTRRPIQLRKRQGNGFVTQEMRRHLRPTVTPQTPDAEQALRLAILRTPAFHGNAWATAASLAFPFGLALLVLDALGIAQTAEVSPTLAEMAPYIAQI